MKFFLLLVLSFPALAEVSQDHMNSMLKQMVRENVISEEDAQKARLRVLAMRPEQWKKVNAGAAGIAERFPAGQASSSNAIEEVHGLDLDGAQFKQIQDDIKKIVPQYRD